MGKLSRIGKEDAGEERVGVGQERGKDLLGFQVECTPIVSTAVQRLEGNDEEAELQLQDPRTLLPPPPVHNSGRATSATRELLSISKESFKMMGVIENRNVVTSAYQSKIIYDYA